MKKIITAALLLAVSTTALAGGAHHSRHFGGADANSAALSVSDADSASSVSTDTFYEAPEIPVGSSFTMPSICTNSSALSGFKISASISQTSSACLRIAVAQKQWTMASQVTCHDHHPKCVTMRAELMGESLATMHTIARDLEDQARPDRLFQVVSRWTNWLGVLVLILVI